MLQKSPEEIKKIQESGKIIGEILSKLAEVSKAGVSTYEIDQKAEKMIRKYGGIPAFKNYKTHVSDRPFPATICASLNSELVHGIPKKEVVLKEGDVFSIDIGMQWPDKKGVYTDTALTLPIGKIGGEEARLLKITQQSLEMGIKAAMPGNSVADIGRAVESYVKSEGKYGIVRDLVGHGVGHAIHEEPSIPNYYDRNLESIKLTPGMVIAIEPMISLGGWRVHTLEDGWTIKMSDNSISAHFEHTIIITDSGNIVATRRPNEKI